MVISDFICDACKHIFLAEKDNYADWSTTLIKCPECGSKKTRIKYSLGDIDIARGIHGNGQTKFDREFTYHPSRYGKIKGTKVGK